MLSLFHFAYNSVKSCNVFTFPVNFRYKLESDYNTFAGGLVSILLILLLISVFFNSWVDLLNKSDISSTTEVIRQFDPDYMKVNTNDFMFAIGVSGINLTDSRSKRYFDLTVSKIYRVTGQNFSIVQYPFTLQPCTISHWQHLGKDFVQTYKKQGLSKFLCPEKNVTIEIEGKWTSKNFSYLKITFRKCTGDNCRTEDEINQWINNKTSFYFDFFYSNVLLNPDQAQPISMFLEDKDYTMFSPTTGTTSNLYLGEYSMSTDESIFPWVQNKIDKGYIINRGQKEVLNFSPGPNDAYCQLYLRKSSVELKIDRKFRKLDDMLSYIGGLFGIIAVAVGIVMKYYGQCSFELEMCQKIFDYNRKKCSKELTNGNKVTDHNRDSSSNVNDTLNCHQENKNYEKQCENDNQNFIEPKDFGFLDFFLYILAYLPFKKVCTIKWKRMELYQESLQEMRKKLDIGHLMEKLSFYDRSINALFDENQLKLLYLQEKYNFHEVRKQRKMFEIRQGFISNLFDQKQENYGTYENQNEDLQRSLKENKRRNGKIVQTFIDGRELVSLIEFEKQNYGNELMENEGKKMNLMRIYKALGRLEQKIQKGDLVSTRIYHSLQLEILQAYQRNKTSNAQEEPGVNRGMKIKLKTKELKKKTRVTIGNPIKEYAQEIASNTLASINRMNERNEEEMNRSGS